MYLTKEFNYYQGNQFSIKIGAIRFENSSLAKSNSSTTSNNVGLNEKIEEIFGLDMSNSVLNVASFISEEDFNIYPNPTLDVLFIKNLDKQQIKEIKIIDSLGKELKKIKHVTNEINLRDFKSGVYYLLIKTEQKIVRKKIIKN